MKNIRKAILLTIAAALILALALCVFVACNGNNKKDKDDLEPADPMIELDSSEIESYLAWMLEESEYNSTIVQWTSYSQQMVDDENLVRFAEAASDPYEPYGQSWMLYNPIGMMGIYSVRPNGMDDDHEIEVIFFASAKEARKYAESVDSTTLEDNQEAIVDGNRVYLADPNEYSYLQNTILTKKLSSSAMNQTLAKDVLKLAQKTVDDFYYASMSFQIFDGGNSIYAILTYEKQSNHVSYIEEIATYRTTGFSKEEIEAEVRELYGDDSTVKFNDDARYLKMSLVSQDEYEIDYGILTDYTTSSKSKSFTVPQYADGMSVTELRIVDPYSFRGITSITVEHGIDVTIRDNNYLETLTLPADVGEVKLSNLPKLTRIRYGGTVAEWKARFSQSAVYEWGNYYQYKNGEVRLAHNDIVVRASDGNVSYEQTPNDKVTITYSLGEYTGGSAPSSQTVDKGTPITLPSAPSWPGHTFTGWRPAGSSTTLGANATYIANQSVTFTAQWTTNGSENPPTPGGESNPPKLDPEAEDAINALFKGAHFISPDPIQQGSNVYAHFALDIEIGTKTASGFSTGKSTTLGVDVQVILDRKSGNSSDTAIKLAFTLGNIDLYTVTFFMNDPRIFYVDYQGEHIKIAADLVDPEKPYASFNDTFADLIYADLNEMSGEYPYTPNQQIDMYLKRAGSGFDLNDIFNWAFEASDTDFVELINSYGLGAGLSIFDMLRIDPDQLYDEDGLHLDYLLASEMFSQIFYTVQKSGDQYTIESSQTVSQIMPINFALKYAVNGDGSFKDGLYVDIMSTNSVATNSASEYPYLSLHIKDAQVASASGKTISTPVSQYQYREEYAFEAQAEANINGTVLRNARITMTAKGCVDLVNTGSANRTRGTLRIDFNGVKYAEISLVDNRLAIAISPNVTLSNQFAVNDIVCPMINNIVLNFIYRGDEYASGYSSFRSTVFSDSTCRQFNSNFKGIVLDNVDIASALNNAAVNLIKSIGGSSSEPEQESGDPLSLVDQLLGMFIPLTTTLQNGRFGLSLGDAGQTICDVLNALDRYMNPQHSGYETFTKQSISQGIASVVNAIIGAYDLSQDVQAYATQIVEDMVCDLALDLADGVDLTVEFESGTTLTLQCGVVDASNFSVNDLSNGIASSRNGWGYVDIRA